MNPQRELINLGKGETFRLLQWHHNVAEVEVVHAPGRTSLLQGQGDHWHYHPASELTFIRKGKGTRLVADHVGSFDSGDLVLIGPNVPHYWHMRGASAGIAVQWDCPLDHGIWSFKEASGLRTLMELARRGLQVLGATADTTRRRIVSLAARAELDRLAGFLEIMAGLVVAPPSELVPLSGQAFSLSGTAETQEAIRRAVSYILANYRESIRLTDLLALTNMSRAKFTREFLLHVGKSFSSFRNQVRLQAVCQALSDTGDPVSSIALSQGFNQLSFFNRLFRRELGFSPSEYRLRLTHTRR
jgi:AraC-like DNA-binding protein/mannose-6-phosphate isomerase-like protein (cupin superfamily)